MPPASSDLELLQGTLDVMILKALSWGAMHGFGVAKWIRQTNDDVLKIAHTALYPRLDLGSLLRRRRESHSRDDPAHVSRPPSAESAAMSELPAWHRYLRFWRA